MTVAEHEAEVVREEPLAGGRPVALSVRARVPGLGGAGLDQSVGRVAGLSPVSNAVRGNVELSVQRELDA